MSYVDGFEQLVKTYRKPNMVVAEIGTYDGATSRYTAPIVKEENGTYIAVDWFKGNETIPAGTPGKTHGYDENQHDIVLNLFKTNLNAVNCLDIVTVYDMPSLEAAKLIPDQSLDICFIDADHRYKAVKADILAYIPKIKSEGILCGHDFDIDGMSFFNQFNPEELEVNRARSVHAGVIQAVGEIIGFEKIGLYPNAVWAIKINKNREFEKL